MSLVPAGLRARLDGVAVGRVVKRVLKPAVLWLLDWIEEDVRENWQRGQGSNDPR